jgi:hypothetical protein
VTKLEDYINPPVQHYHKPTDQTNVTGSQWRVPVCSGTHIVDRSDKFSLSADGSSAEFPECYGIDDVASTDTTSAVADGKQPWR